MMQQIRSNVQGTAAKIIIAIIIVPFAVFGIDSLFTQPGNPAVAYVNGEKIEESELTRAIELQKRRLQSLLGGNVAPEMLDDTVLRPSALDGLIQQELLLQEAESANVQAGTNLLNARIVQMPQFQENGQFSQQRYDTLLRQQGYSSAFFKQLLASDVRRQHLQAGVAASAFVTPAQKEVAVKFRDQRRSFTAITFPVQSLFDQVDLNEEDVVAAWEADKQSYMSPEQVKLSFIQLTLSDFAPDVADSEIRAEYELEVAAAEAEKELQAAHIQVEAGDVRSDEEALQRAKEAAQRIASGADFGQVAEEYSDDLGSAAAAGVLGFTTGDTFPPEFEQALAELQVDEVSEPVKIDDSYHLIKLVSVTTSDLPSFEERADAIRARLVKQKARPELLTAVEELKDLSFNSEGLSLPARELGVEVQTSDWISATSRDGLFSNSALRTAALDPELRRQKINSEVIEFSPERFVVIHVDAYQEAKQRPLEEVRERVEAKLKTARAQKLAEQRAAEIADQLRSGADADELAKPEGADVVRAEATTRDASDLDADIVAKAFAMPKPEDAPVVSSQALSNGDYAVIALTKVENGDIRTASAERLEAFENELKNRRSGAALGAYFATVKSDADIEIK